MKCKICGTNNSSCFKGTILNKYEIKYYQCSKCDFVQTENPYWLDEAYSSPITSSDTGYISRNIFYSKRVSILLFLLFGNKPKVLDFAGGYGVFVRLMRDIGFNFYWDDKYTPNLFSKGHEWDKKSRFDAITLFEVFEHFINPIDEIEGLLKTSKTLIFSTTLYPKPLPSPQNWWYFGLEHGQHTSLYSKKTFYIISENYNLNYYNIGDLHILTNKRISSIKLFLIKLDKLGFHKLIFRLLKSKTWLDHESVKEKP